MSRTLRNFLTFFLVLVLTVVTVTALSLATQAKTETAAAEYTERLETVQKEETAKLTAVVPEKDAARRYSPRSDMTFRTTARSRV